MIYLDENIQIFCDFDEGQDINYIIFCFIYYIINNHIYGLIKTYLDHISSSKKFLFRESNHRLSLWLVLVNNWYLIR